MIIKKIYLGRLAIPLKTPFVTALRRVEAMDELMVFIETGDGRVGHGEAPPTAAITGDTIESMTAAMQIMAPMLIERDIETDFADILNLVHNSIPGCTSGKAALEIALYDLWAQSRNEPLFRALGGVSPHLRTGLTVSIGSIEKMVGDAVKAVSAGFDHLKIKVGHNAEEDVERLSAIRAAVGSQVVISVDANQGWSVNEAIAAMNRLESAGLEFDYLEQPVKACDLEGLRTVRRAIKTPVLADEAVFAPEDALRLLEYDAADFINIKLMKSAGISRALRIAEVAAEYDARCMIGVMLEGPVSVSAAASFAASRPEIITRFDLDGPSLASINPMRGGAKFEGPDIFLSEQPGLGIDGVDSVTITREFA